MIIIEVDVSGGYSSPLMFVNGQNIRNTSQYNAVWLNTTAGYIEFMNASLRVSIKTELIIFVKVEFMAELLYWIALHFTGVPNKVATEYITYIQFYTDSAHVHRVII